jgi:hypothetical protein
MLYMDAWDRVHSNFNVLARDGFLERADFARCIGTFFVSELVFFFFFFLIKKNGRFQGVHSFFRRF